MRIIAQSKVMGLMGKADSQEDSVGSPRISPCNLCPRACGARRDEGEAGACGAADKLYVARAALHFWEEPPLSGTSGSGAVFFSLCPLKCAYCQNALIAEGRAGVAVSVERLAGMLLDLEAQGALNVNLVTPTHYSLQAMAAIRIARDRGLAIPVVWNTSGYERIETIHMLAGTADVFLADFKYADARIASRYSNAPDYPEVAMRAIQAMVDVAGPPAFDEHDGQRRLARGVVVRHLMLPGSSGNSREAARMLYEQLGDSVLYSFMNQYTPVISGERARRFPELMRRVSLDEYEELLDYADELGIEEYFWQDGPAADASFIPAWDGTGVNA